MNPNSMFGIRHWDLPQILFVAAGCFAMAAVGFFIAVFLQVNTFGADNQSGTYREIPIEEKIAADSIPYERGDGQTTAPLQIDPSEQIYENDPDAVQKLRMMETQYAR